MSVQTHLGGVGSLTLPTLQTVHWGSGSITRLVDALDRHDAQDVAVVTSAALRQSRLLEKLRQASGGRVRAVLDVPAHVPRDTVTDLTAQIRSATPAIDGVISFGGGSAIDGAKAILAAISTSVRTSLLHVAVPTNLSGAELSGGFGVSEARDGVAFKQSYLDTALAPTVVFYDPRMTVTTPPELWAASGIKSLDHAVEGLLVADPRPVISPLALDGIHRLNAGLERSLTDVDARAEMQLAAWQCYFAPTNIRYGLSHRLGHILGGTFGLPHSLTSAITLAPVVRAAGHSPAATSRTEALRAIAAALGVEAVSGASADLAADAAAERIEQLVAAVRLPHRFRDAGLRERADLLEVARLMRTHYPEIVDPVGADELVALLNDLW